jgi:hypothetical protein
MDFDFDWKGSIRTVGHNFVGPVTFAFDADQFSW